MSNFCPACGGNGKQTKDGRLCCVFCGTVWDPNEAPAAAPAPAATKKSAVTQKVSEGVGVYDSNINAVLEIRWGDGQYIYSGSGFLISKSGYAVTNTHVVTDESGRSCGRMQVKIADETVMADVVTLGDNKHGHGRGVDLALIRLSQVPSAAVVAKLGDFATVKNGETVFVIGNSLGYGTCITSGIVSDRLRSVNGDMLMMTDCAVNGGNSGGPVFNEFGEVIAVIVSGIDDAEGMNFAIPMDTVINFLDKTPAKGAF